MSSGMEGEVMAEGSQRSVQARSSICHIKITPSEHQQRALVLLATHPPSPPNHWVTRMATSGEDGEGHPRARSASSTHKHT